MILKFKLISFTSETSCLIILKKRSHFHACLLKDRRDLAFRRADLAKILGTLPKGEKVGKFQTALPAGANNTWDATVGTTLKGRERWPLQVRLEQAGEQPQQRGLAGTVGSHHSDDVALRDGQVCGGEIDGARVQVVR